MDEERTWDLSILLNDTSIEGVTRSTDAVISDLRNAVARLNESQEKIRANQLVKLIQKYETCLERFDTLLLYTYCKHVEDTNAVESQTLGSLFYKLKNEGSAQDRLFDQILGDIIKKNPEVIESPELVSYRHQLHKSSQKLPYLLSQVEEELVAEKDTNGISAMSQLQSSWVASQLLDVNIEGKIQQITMNQAFSLAMSEKRETREEISRKYFGSFASDKLIHGTALQSICSDHVSMTKRRKWPSYMTQSFIDQDVDEDTISTLLKTLEENTQSVQKYIKLKMKHFGYDRLLNYDLRAPWLSKSPWNRDLSSVKTAIIKAFDRFDEEFGNHVRDLFANRRIDSEDRPGRAGLGFCASSYEKKTSFVFITYNDTLNDAYILAHELGHGIHSHYMYNNLNILNGLSFSTCIAETGSIFGELLLTDQLLRECDSDELRLEILGRILDRFYSTTFWISQWTFFEQRAYEAIENGEILNADKACEIWRAIRTKIYGDTIEWTENTEFEWARVANLFFPNFRFYNYSYSFGQLLVFAVYEEYKQGSSNFKERFKRFLSRGGSMSPREQIAELGYDITKPDFWTLGIQRAEHFMDDLQKLL
ncbi:MAG: M3 family metallopeptidase [Candidatus Thorarchaeota archaeon]